MCMCPMATGLDIHHLATHCKGITAVVIKCNHKRLTGLRAPFDLHSEQRPQVHSDPVTGDGANDP